MRNIVSSDATAEAAAAARRKELAAVQVRAEDVTLLTSELEMSEEAADALLREHNNDVAAAIRTVINKK